MFIQSLAEVPKAWRSCAEPQINNSIQQQLAAGELQTHKKKEKKYFSFCVCVYFVLC